MKITCHHCLQPSAIQTIAGERSSQYRCTDCGEVFEADHPPLDRQTSARPQTFTLPAVGGVPAIEPVGVNHAS